MLKEAIRSRLSESAGDVILRKFIYIYIERVPDFIDYDRYYRSELNGYYIDWSFIYNTVTHQTDDRDYPHSSVIDSLPSSLRSSFLNDKGIWGREDYGKNPYVSDRPPYIPEDIYNKVRNYFINQ